MSWIKIEHTILSKPEVMQLAEILSLSEFEVVGHLVAFWTWVDCNLSPSCPVVRGTKSGLDRVCGITGMVDALCDVGWLTVDGCEFSVPNIERHLSKGAKQRAEENRKKQNQRSSRPMSGVCPESVPKPKGQKRDTSGTKPGPDKIREDKSIEIFGADVLIPAKMNVPEVHDAARLWFKYLESKAPDKIPEPNSEQMQAFWRQQGRIGPEKFVEAVDNTMANGWINLQSPKEPRDPPAARSVKQFKTAAEKLKENNDAVFAEVFGIAEAE